MMKPRSGAYRRHRDQDVDDWLMTYADMITLLLCFFAVFLSVSVPKKDTFREAREKVLEEFAAPNIRAGDFPMPESQDGRTGGVHNALPSIVDRFHTGEGRSVGEGVDAGEGASEGMGEGAQQGTGDKPQEEPPEEIRIGHPGGAKPPPPGDRITIIEMPSAAFFASGSADLSPEGKALLTDFLVRKLNTPDFADYQVTIEGHTDDVPIRTPQFPSNWELSTARAAAVVRFLIAQGVPAARLRAAGYADVFPKAPNRGPDGKAMPDNQAANRRVVIKLEKIEKLP
jgi:chemotaxis protein MotB